MQFGGSDQWGNMINGVDLNRKVDQTQVFAVTAPLITTADGKKMGKSASGAVWLNADLLPPYDYWQFWRNTDDADVERFLKLFTEIPLDEITKLAALKGKEINEAKVVLADAATTMLHGAECLDSIKTTASSVFAGKAGADTADLPRVQFASSDLDAGVPVVDILIELSFAKSKGEARRLIKGGGARVAGEKVEDEAMVLQTEALKGEKEIRISSGKKKHGIVEMV